LLHILSHLINTNIHFSILEDIQDEHKKIEKKNVISSSSQRPCELFTVLGIPIHPSSMLHHKLFIFKSSPLKPLYKI